LAFEALRGFTLSRNALRFHNPLPYELKEVAVKTIFIGRKPLANYFIEARRILSSEGQVILRAKGNLIGKLFTVLLLLDDFPILVRRWWLWLEKDRCAYACIAVHLVRKGAKRPLPLKKGDKWVYEGGWRRVSKGH